MELVDAKTFVQVMQYAFLPQKAGNTNAVFYLNLSGPGGGEWTVIISDGTCRIREGAPEKWDVQLIARDDDFVRISIGSLINRFVAVLTSKLIIKGSRLLALRFDGFFAKPKDFSLKSLFEFLPQIFKPERTGGVAAAVQFDVDGPGGGQWTVRIDSGRCWVQKGPASDASVVIKGNYNTIRHVLLYPSSAMNEYMGGRLKITGNMALALRFPTWFV